MCRAKAAEGDIFFLDKMFREMRFRRKQKSPPLPFWDVFISLSTFPLILLAMLGEKYHISHFPSLFSFSSYSNPEWLFRPRLYGKRREALYNFDTFHSLLCLYPVFKVYIDRQPFSLDFHTFREYSSILFRSWSTSVSLLRKLIPSFFLPSSSYHFYFPDFPINLRMMMISFSRENGNLIYVPVFRGSLVFSGGLRRKFRSSICTQKR